MDLKKLNREVHNRLSIYPKHNRHLVEIRTSKIPGAGFGLFAKYDIPKDTVIDYYYGKNLTKKEFNQSEDHECMYIMEINKNHYIDGETEKNFISYCNDARGLTRVPGIRNNSYFCITEDGKNMAMVTSRNIKADEELFVFYGSSYWNVVKRLQSAQI